MIKLDLKDRKILSELDWNAKITNSEIAKKVGLNKKSIEYRIKKLEEEVIEGYYPVINFLKLGYYYGRALVKFYTFDHNIKEKIENYLKKDKDAKWCIWVKGEYDLCIGFWAKSLREFKLNFNDFNDKFGKWIKEVKFSLAFELDQYPSDFIMGKREIIREMKMTELDQKISLDDLDQRILTSLSKNARQNSSEIAREVGSNYKTVIYRINKMFKEDILLGTRAAINFQLLDKTYYKLLIHLSQGAKKDIEKIKNHLKKIPEVIYFVEDVGIADLDIEIIFNSNNEFFNFIENLKDKFKDSIKDTNYMIFDRTFKISYLPEFNN